VVLARVAGDLLVGGAAVVADVGGEADAVGDVVEAADEKRLTLDAGLHHHLFVGIGPLGQREVVVVGRIARIGAPVQGAVAGRAGAADRRAVRPQRADPYAVLADQAPAVVRDVGAVAVPGELAVLAVDRIVLGVLGADGDAAAVVAGAHGEAVVLLGLAFVERTDVAVELGAFEVAAGDDVDHAGDGVGTVVRRGAVLEDFDALDRGHRHLPEVLQARGRNAKALAVEQHQGALRPQVAQVDEIATHVLAGRERHGARYRGRAGRGEVLQDIGDRVEALLFDLGATDGDDRLLVFDFRARDARAGHLDAVERGGLARWLRVLRAGVLRNRQRKRGRRQRREDRAVKPVDLQGHLDLQVLEK